MLSARVLGLENDVPVADIVAYIQEQFDTAPDDIITRLSLVGQQLAP